LGSKILATLTAVIGAIGVLYSLLAAFGVELSQTQQEAITGLAGLVLIVSGIWLHPGTPVGEKTPPDA
jgi:cadmium resistance protein CadD (predicted permease)